MSQDKGDAPLQDDQIETPPGPREEEETLPGPQEAVSSAGSAPEEPEYELPLSCDEVSSPLYSTVNKPSRLNLDGSSCGSSMSISTYARPGSLQHDYDLTPGSGVVSYASTMVIPVTPVSDYPIKNMKHLNWLPKVPKKQRCVQVSVMEEDLRTTRREMLFCDVRHVTEDNRDLTLVNWAGESVYRTCYDVGTGAYGILLDNEQLLKRNSERLIGNSRVVGCLFKLECTKTRDIWELRDPQTGKTNALIKIRKWNGFMHGCVHVNRGTEGVVKKADIKIRRVRGSSDVIVAAVLNDQIITTIRQGAGRDGTIDRNIFALFVAPYIDSVAVISVFTCIAHIQQRYERPRTTSNIIAMLLAKEARETGRQLSTNAVKMGAVLSKSTTQLSGTIVAAIQDADRETKIIPRIKTIRVGTFPVRTPSTPTGSIRSFRRQVAAKVADPGDEKGQSSAKKLSPSPMKHFSDEAFAPKKKKGSEKKLSPMKKGSQKKHPGGKKMTLQDFKKKYGDVKPGKKRSESQKEAKLKSPSQAKTFVVNAYKGTERELSNFGKQAEAGFKKVSVKTSENISRFMEKRNFFGGVSTPTQNAETA